MYACTTSKAPGKRYLYKLLRIGDLDAEVASAAKERHLASNLLDQVARLSKKEAQLELVRIIADSRLTEKEAREIVKRKLESKDASLFSIAALVAPAAHLSPSGAVVHIDAEDVETDRNASVKVVVDTKEGGEIGQVADNIQQADGGVQNSGETKWKAMNLAPVVECLRNQASLDLLYAADVLEGWTKRKHDQQGPGGEMLKQWLTGLAAGEHDPKEIERLETILTQGEYTVFDAEPIKLLFPCQGVLPEQLPGFLRVMRESIAESAWYRSFVKHALGLLGILGEPEESKKVSAISRRLVEAVFYELFWLATIYEPRLQHWVERLPPSRKKEFARQVRLRTHTRSAAPATISQLLNHG